MKYRVLFVHNKYGVHSGEEAMIERIMDLLRQHGHQVETFFKESKDLEAGLLPKVKAFFSGIYSVSAKRELAKIVEEFQPDIVQIQNLFPLISPSVLPMLKKKGIPVVMRLSNYRLICPSGLFMSHGELCNRCRGGKEYWCVIRNCENSRLKSIGYALRNAVARRFRFYSNNVTRYYAQTAFQKELIGSEGFSVERIGLIPNMVQPLENGHQVGDIGSFVGFVGRMSPEKGVDVFLEAARACPDILFKIAGDAGKYQSQKELPVNAELLGHLNRDDLDAFYQQCRFVVVPSLWYEGFPGVIIEAMRYAKPVIASRIGGLPEIVEHEKTGLLFEPGNSEALSHLIARFWDNDVVIQQLGKAGCDKVTKDYSPELYYNRLIEVYDHAIFGKTR